MTWAESTPCRSSNVDIFKFKYIIRLALDQYREEMTRDDRTQRENRATIYLKKAVDKNIIFTVIKFNLLDSSYD